MRYAIARGKTRFNPAAAIEARFIATARSRDVALSQAEIGQLLRGIYQSSIRLQYKLALHLLVLCMIRKGELIGARWDEIDFEKSEWLIPAGQAAPGAIVQTSGRDVRGVDGARQQVAVGAAEPQTRSRSRLPTARGIRPSDRWTSASATS